MLRHKARPGNAVSVEKNQIVGRSQTGSEVASLRSGKAHVRVPNVADGAFEVRTLLMEHLHFIRARSIIGNDDLMRRPALICE